MKVFKISLSLMFCAFAVAGCSAATDGCGGQATACPSGYVCQEEICRQVCNASSDCADSEACINNICERYDEFCSVSTDCEPGWYCAEGTCTAQTPLGQQCAQNDVCESGFCVEGHCCNAACSDDCESCLGGNTGELNGSCAPITAGQDPNDICAGPLACDGAGACFAKTEGESCQEGYECVSGECDNGYCAPPACGNGTTQVGEDCDDGNTQDDANGCSENCTRNDVCGNGIHESLFETCDDGNVENEDYCSSDCSEVIGSCGDDILQTNEICDDGNQVDDGNGCSELCEANNICGDGLAQSEIEACDDGNTAAGDYCAEDCLSVTGFCGDQEEQDNEDCDDGNTSDDDNGCSAMCTDNSQCGDGQLESYFEECDDGNTTSDGNGCDEWCQREGNCGDGVLDDLFEACDDGNNLDADYCSAECSEITGSCGDGTIQGNEVCDDGNSVSGDYCSADCQTVTGSCGDGAVQVHEGCDDGATAAGDGCSSLCQVEPYFACGASTPTRCSRVVFVNDTAAGTGDGSTWENAYTDLQPALVHAATLFDTFGAPEIWLAQGVYRPSWLTDNTNSRSATFSLGSEIVLLGGFTGGERDHKSRTPLVNETILSGDINFSGNEMGGAFHVVTVLQDATPVIDGVIIEWGNAESNCINCNDKEGGGLFNSGGSPKVLNTVFRNNHATGSFAYGGAVSNQDGNATFVNVLMHNNYARSATIRNLNGTVDFINCTVAANTASSVTAGMMNSGATVTIYNSIFWDNTIGGVVAADISTSGSSTDVGYSALLGYTNDGNFSGDPGLNANFYPSHASVLDSGSFNYLPFDETDSDDDLLFTERFPVDLAGIPRINPPEVDMGAFEAP